MDTKELRIRLRSLSAEAQAVFPYLNNGGCCVFAAAVAEELEGLGVQYEVIVPGSRGFNVNDVRPKRNTMKNWEFGGIYFGHVAVRMKLKGRWYTYDSEKFLRSKYRFGSRYFGEHYEAASGGLTAKEATELADTGDWNKIFYNNENVKAVRQMVKKHFVQ